MQSLRVIQDKGHTGVCGDRDANKASDFLITTEKYSVSRPHLYWSMHLLPGEAHDYESKCRHTVKCPLGKAEVVNEGVDVCWDYVENTQKTLKQGENKLVS